MFYDELILQMLCQYKALLGREEVGRRILIKKSLKQLMDVFGRILSNLFKI